VESLCNAIEDPSHQSQPKKRKLESTLTVPHQWIWTKIHSLVGDIDEEDEVPGFNELETRILSVPSPGSSTCVSKTH
jgi:hypothetical protein